MNHKWMQKHRNLTPKKEDYPSKEKKIPLKWNENLSLYLGVCVVLCVLKQRLSMGEVPALLFKRRKLSQMKFTLNEPQIRSREILTVGLEYLIHGPQNESRWWWKQLAHFRSLLFPWRIYPSSLAGTAHQPACLGPRASWETQFFTLLVLGFNVFLYY